MNAVNEVECTQDFIAVFKKQADKMVVINENKNKFIETHCKGIEVWEEERKSAQNEVASKMPEFTQVVSQISQDSAKMEFFKHIDEALNIYNEVLGMISQGSQFYNRLAEFL